MSFYTRIGIVFISLFLHVPSGHSQEVNSGETKLDISDSLALKRLAGDALDSTFFQFVPKIDYGELLQQGGFTTFTTDFQPSGSTWGEACNEEDVFLARLKHTAGADDSWDLRIGKGGQIYSFIGPYGEGVPPSSKEHSRWNDEVWQIVSVCGEKNNSYSNGGVGDMNYFIHGAGIYLREETQSNTFYSPLMASYYNQDEKAYYVTNWGQQAHVPSIHKSEVLYTTKYKDLGEGVLEVTYIIQNFGNDVLNHLNMPWGGVRSSNLRGQFISLPDNSLQVTTANTGTEAGLLDIDQTAGYFIYASDTVSPTSPSMGIVFGNEVRKNDFAENNLSRIYFRFAQVGGDANPRDYSLFVVIPKIEVRSGETFYYRVYYINGNREDVHEKSKMLAEHTDYGFVNPPAEDVPIVTLKTTELDSAFTNDVNLFASPMKGMIPIFLMENTETGNQYISPDLYYNVSTEPFVNPYNPGDDEYETYQNLEINRPYDGKVKFIRLLGYGIRKGTPLSTNIRFGLLDTMIVNNKKIVLTNNYKNQILVPVSYCSNCNESNDTEEYGGITLYSDFYNKSIVDFKGVVALDFGDSVPNPDMTGEHTDPFVGKIVRDTAVHANIRFDLPQYLDFSVQPFIQLKGFFESQESGLPDNCKISIILRNSATGGTGQHVVHYNFKEANQWEDMTFDCSGAVNKGPYDQLWLFFSMSDASLETSGQVFYIDDLKGPAFKISPFELYSSENGQQIIIDLTANSALIETIEYPVFTVFKNETEDLTITNITFDDEHIYLDLDESSQIKWNDDLSMSFIFGKVMDSKGKILFHFNNETVTNRIVPEQYRLSFNVYEGDESSPLSNVSIEIGDGVYYTNEQGNLTLEIDEGPYEYKVFKENYNAYNGSLDLSEELSLQIILNLTTGLNAGLAPGIKIFPNPTFGSFQVKSDEIVKKISVLNNLGQMICAYEVNKSFFKINTSRITAGLYYLKVDFLSGQSRTEMIQVAN